MKKSVKLFAIVLIAVVTVSSSSFATNHVSISDTTEMDVTVKKDWKLLAKQSEYLINKNTNLETAKAWLKESLSIEKAAYNLDLMGDLHAKNNNSKQAIKYYIKAMNAMKTEDVNVDTQAIQMKIEKAKR